MSLRLKLLNAAVVVLCCTQVSYANGSSGTSDYCQALVDVISVFDSVASRKESDPNALVDRTKYDRYLYQSFHVSLPDETKRMIVQTVEMADAYLDGKNENPEISSKKISDAYVEIANSTKCSLRGRQPHDLMFR